MDAEEIKRSIIQVVAEVQKTSGEPDSPISSSTIPLTGLPGFDSFRAMEVLSKLSDKLGKELNEKMSLFLDEKSYVPYDIDGIAAKIMISINKRR